MVHKKITNDLFRRKAKTAEPQKVLVAAILEASIHILTQEGTNRFTSTSVAERAGMSVGSLYQYFPNKASILLQRVANTPSSGKAPCHDWLIYPLRMS
ncbi:TetR/AcrR family transcriptional regulator [Celerinatantimonas diazotrophica]|uniref:TetR/AcrR family transcriptional regulator n=1 Tax=Celerinatantimonas diazotrophica TaxID=412034 RepID=UPI00295F5192|nr:helix-turn-helix domain-containing protein [Celerinatantimonas diazotrophica]